tara:strand:+ start:1048 stop:1359 length:312 start_codon:yes stop_codon:yes gene_type:complete
MEQIITDFTAQDESIVWERYESILLAQGYWIEENFNDYFKDAILPMVAQEYEQDGVPDIPARREAYNNAVDNLCRDGGMTEYYASQMNGIPDSLEEMIIRVNR